MESCNVVNIECQLTKQTLKHSPSGINKAENKVKNQKVENKKRKLEYKYKNSLKWFFTVTDTDSDTPDLVMVSLMKINNYCLFNNFSLKFISGAYGLGLGYGLGAYPLARYW